jgi:hypothetical protein
MQSFITPENPGSVVTFRNIAKSGEVTANGTSRYEIHPTALENFYADLMDSDPNSSEWSVEGLNSAEFGVEVL